MIKKVIQNKIRKLEKNNNSPRRIIPFGQAESVAIIFDHHLSAKDEKIIMKWVSWLKGKEKLVEVCKINRTKLKKGADRPANPYELFSNDFNFFSRPKREEAIVFMHKEFDYLISFQTKAGSQMKWMCAASKAKLRLGPVINGEKLQFCDLYIQSEHRDLSEVMDEIETTLTHINERN